MFKKLIFTFGCVTLQTAEVLINFVKGCFSGMVMLKQSRDEKISGEL